jgi:hypothetical protein
VERFAGAGFAAHLQLAYLLHSSTVFGTLQNQPPGGGPVHRETRYDLLHAATLAFGA